jgi:hypothetical protein
VQDPRYLRHEVTDAPVPSRDELRRLRAAAAAWVAEVCQAFETNPPYTRRSVVTAVTATSYETRDALTLDLLAIERRARDLDLRSFDRMSEIAVGRRDVFQQIAAEDDERGTQRIWASSVLGEPILRAYVERAGSMRFDPALFDTVFDDLERELQSQATPYTAVAAIDLLDLPDGPVEILPGVTLRPRTNADLEQWVDRRLPRPQLNYIGVTAVLERPYLERRLELLGARRSQDLLSRLMRAIQLHGDCDAHEAFVHFRRDATFYAGMGGTITGPARFSQLRGTLATGDVDAIRALYNQLDASPNLAACEIALDRWNSLSAGGRPQGLIVDAWVGLESLLLRDDATEIAYRASLRLAALIGPDAADRRFVFAGAKKAYNGRSRVLHGADTSKVDLSALAEQSRGYLRRALIAILMLDAPFDPQATEERLLS